MEIESAGSKEIDVLKLGLSQLEDVKQLRLFELNGRPVVLRPVTGMAKCSLCECIAKVTVFELWRGKRLDDDVSREHRVWHWCGGCSENPFPSITDAR